MKVGNLLFTTIIKFLLSKHFKVHVLHASAPAETGEDKGHICVTLKSCAPRIYIVIGTSVSYVKSVSLSPPRWVSAISGHHKFYTLSSWQYSLGSFALGGEIMFYRNKYKYIDGSVNNAIWKVAFGLQSKKNLWVCHLQTYGRVDWIVAVLTPGISTMEFSVSSQETV